jgi:hypothetical protein
MARTEMEKRLFEALVHRIYNRKTLDYYCRPTAEERLLIDTYLEKGEYIWAAKPRNTSTESTECTSTGNADATSAGQ